MYRQIILDHYKHPCNFGHLNHPDAHATRSNSACGDVITMEVQFGKKNGNKMISDIRFSGDGCAISQASASMLTMKVQRMSVAHIKRLSAKEILSMLGTTLTPTRVKCALLPLEALQQAVTT